MTSPILALRAAVRARCLADAALASLMGGPGAVHDEPPAAAEPIYAVFADGTARDRSSATERGHEQDLTIAVWARPGSAASALRVAERLSDLLDGASLPLDGHRLVLLAVAETRTGRDPRSGLTRVALKLNAVTETA